MTENNHEEEEFPIHEGPPEDLPRERNGVQDDGEDDDE